MANEAIKLQIDTDITNKTSAKSITPLNVGENMKAVVDLIPENFKTINNESILGTGNITTPDGTQDLQSVLDNGNIAQGELAITDGELSTCTIVPFALIVGGYSGSNMDNKIQIEKERIYFSNEFNIETNSTGGVVNLRKDNLLDNTLYTLQLPAKNNTEVNTIATLDDIVDSRPYKVYTALLNQSGTNAPVATILENTLVGDIIWSYDNIGGYIGTLTGVFTNNKTAIMLTASLTGIIINGKVEDMNTISIGTMSIVGPYVDNSLVNTTIEIRVYN